MRDRLIELYKKIEKEPAITCPAYKTDKTCKDCQYSINDSLCNHIERQVDYLLANGVVALPCKVGQLVYCIIRGTYHCQLMHGTVLRVEISKDRGSFYVSINGYFGQHYTFTDVGKNVFFTREEADRALKEVRG